MCLVWFPYEKQESMLVVLNLKFLDNMCYLMLLCAFLVKLSIVSLLGLLYYEL